MEEISDVTVESTVEVEQPKKYNKTGIFWPTGVGGIPPGAEYETMSGRKYRVDEHGAHRRIG